MHLSPEPPQTGLRMVPLQRLTAGGRWRAAAMRSYRAPLLLWFTRGQGRVTVAGTTSGFGAHNAIFLPARTMHGFEAISQIFGTAVFFGTDPDPTLPDHSLHLRIRDVMAQAELTALLETINREDTGDRPARHRALQHYSGLLSVWLERQVAVEGPHKASKTAMDLAARFTALIEDQLFTGQNVSDYAEALGVTPTHLSRVCRETCGRPASDLLADRITFEARRLLIDTKLPVRRVAEVLGFTSPAYFTRAFRARTGLTPSEFREKPQH
ncbi:helix-turn-helix domain-containing protein [Actibacterium sp. 188UL27-1]|nr:helix-turn-helix domain-containing protein [Actibacterium sp. 188UL27-1]